MRPLLLLCLVLPALCQPSFTVASVKPVSEAGRKMPSIVVDPGRISFSNVTLKTLVTRAYSVKDYQVSGPAWIGNEMYTLAATMPPETPPATVWQMLQSLLAERFQLKVKRASQEMAVYALTVGKGGPKLKTASAGELGTQIVAGGFRLTNARMPNLVNLLTAFLDRPVVDETGLDGAYDVALDFTPDPSLGRAMAKLSAEAAQTGKEATGASIFTAVQEQLGLKLEGRKAPVEMIVVESANKVPTEN